MANDNEVEGPISLLRPCFLIILLAILSLLILWFFLDSQTLAILLLITTFAFLGPIYCLTERAKSGRTRFEAISSRASIMSETYEEIASEELNLGVRYVFPIQCPQCNEPLDPGSVEWIDGTSAICPNCRTTVRARIEET
ncbi:MAG: hypothetical protein ACW97A_05470 [Candidatus Thorarchaeota archaeon]